MADFTMDRFSLKGKTALVTGAERGIGLEIAKGLAAAGANIIIAGLMEEEFQKAEAAVRAKGVSCTVLKADISKEEDVLRLAEQAWEIFPNGLDILVNNAGVNKLAPAEEMPLEVWQKVVGVNLTGTFLMCRTFGNRMLQQGHGNIVNVASMSGLVVNPLPQQQCAYNSSKAGVIMLTARTQEADKVNGLMNGADDYVTKPFTPLELLARVNSHLRRYSKYLTAVSGEEQEKSHVYTIGGLELNEETVEVTVDGEAVKLTPMEFKIVQLLIKNPGRVFSADEIYERIWNEKAVNTDTIMVHVRNIREKIEIDPRNPKYLKVVWGTGYKVG